MTATARQDQIAIRRTFGDGDADAIAELHRRVYVAEHAMNDEFISRVAEGVRSAVAGGWPADCGGVWLIDRRRDEDRGSGRPALSGSLALTDEGGGLGRLRWFVLDPALRGHGLGRSLVSELIAHARDRGFDRLELETFSALSTAARIYRDAGFRVTWAGERTDWGRPITYQHYRLELG